MRTYAGCLAALLLLLWSQGSAASDDGVALSVQKGPGLSEVTLSWSGREPIFEVYRSSDPPSTVGPPNKLGETQDDEWIDTPPPAALRCYQVVSRPPLMDDLLPAANDVAGYMETNRILPDSISYGTQTINSAQFLFLASKTILALSSEDPFPPDQPPPGLVPPGGTYLPIPPDDSFSRYPFTRAEYLAFFRQIDEWYEVNQTYPPGILVDGTEAVVRYPAMVYYAAGVLRAQQMLGYLPDFWNKFLIATKGLVPWPTPPGYEEYTSALHPYGTPFFPNHPRRYHAASAHEYAMFDLARSIYSSTFDPYVAGELIFEWVKDQWSNVVGYTSGRTQFEEDRSGWHMAHHFYHTSGPPKRVMTYLMRACGIPASVSGAAYFTGHGWVNIDQHRPYGTDPLENPFYHDTVPPKTYNMPYPLPDDDFIPPINEISARVPVAARPGEQRSIYFNPSDVLDYGASYVVDRAGDFDTLVITVKSVQGYLYFGSSGWPERERDDALAPLIAEAHHRGKKVYAAFSTLGDRVTAEEHPEWRQQLNESGVYPNLNISPCVASYRDRLTDLLQNLVWNYDVDGVVLDYLFYANVFGNEDTVGHPDCPTGTDWMSGVLSDYAGDLADAIHAVDPYVATVIGTFPLGRENRYYGLASEEIGHQDLQALSLVADDIMLAFLGTTWVPVDPPYWPTAISDYQALTGMDPWVSFALVDEWEYPPRFYRGLVYFARESGIAGFNLHNLLSTLGELSPALTPAEWDVVGAIDLSR